MGGGGGSEALSRAVYVRKVHPSTSYEELVNEVGVYGPMESIRIEREAAEAYINYIDGASAAALLQERPTLLLHGVAAELTWGKARPMQPELAIRIQQGATRNLYLGNIPEGTREELVFEKFAQFGAIESVRVMRNYSTGYVNFCAVESAIAARERYHLQKVSSLLPDVGGIDGDKELQVTFTSAQQNARGRRGVVGGMGGRAGGMGGGIMGGGRMGGMGGGAGGSGMGGGGSMGGGMGGPAGGKGKGGFENGHKAHGGIAGLQRSRSVYVGSLPPGVGMGDLADLAVPFGILESLRWVGNNYAFLNFVDIDHAVHFWQAGQPTGPGIYLRGVRLLLNWAKAPALDPGVLKLVENGATRHLKLSNISHQVTQQQVGELFRQYGDVESIRLLPEEGGALVNLASISGASAAKESLDGLQLPGGGGASWTLRVSFVKPPTPQLAQQPRNTLM